ncbi:MAG: hypothetical protein ACTSVT_12650, partial [Candidatus Thorarchaeota archaeon]
DLGLLAWTGDQPDWFATFVRLRKLYWEWVSEVGGNVLGWSEIILREIQSVALKKQGVLGDIRDVSERSGGGEERAVAFLEDIASNERRLWKLVGSGSPSVAALGYECLLSQMRYNEEDLTRWAPSAYERARSTLQERLIIAICRAEIDRILEISKEIAAIRELGPIELAPEEYLDRIIERMQEGAKCWKHTLHLAQVRVLTTIELIAKEAFASLVAEADLARRLVKDWEETQRYIQQHLDTIRARLNALGDLEDKDEILQELALLSERCSGLRKLCGKRRHKVCMECRSVVKEIDQRQSLLTRLQRLRDSIHNVSVPNSGRVREYQKVFDGLAAVSDKVSEIVLSGRDFPEVTAVGESVSEMLQERLSELVPAYVGVLRRKASQIDDESEKAADQLTSLIRRVRKLLVHSDILGSAEKHLERLGNNLEKRLAEWSRSRVEEIRQRAVSTAIDDSSATKTLERLHVEFGAVMKAASAIEEGPYVEEIAGLYAQVFDILIVRLRHANEHRAVKETLSHLREVVGKDVSHERIAEVLTELSGIIRKCERLGSDASTDGLGNETVVFEQLGREARALQREAVTKCLEDLQQQLHVVSSGQSDDPDSQLTELVDWARELLGVVPEEDKSHLRAILENAGKLQKKRRSLNRRMRGARRMFEEARTAGTPERYAMLVKLEELIRNLQDDVTKASQKDLERECASLLSQTTETLRRALTSHIVSMEQSLASLGAQPIADESVVDTLKNLTEQMSQIEPYVSRFSDLQERVIGLRDEMERKSQLVSMLGIVADVEEPSVTADGEIMTPEYALLFARGVIREARRVLADGKAMSETSSVHDDVLRAIMIARRFGLSSEQEELRRLLEQLRAQ